MVTLAEFDDGLGLGRLLPLDDVNFHVHGLDEIQALGGLQVLRRAIRFAEDRIGRVEPVQAELLQVPQMLMGIDDRQGAAAIPAGSPRLGPHTAGVRVQPGRGCQPGRGADEGPAIHGC